MIKDFTSKDKKQKKILTEEDFDVIEV